MAGLLACVSPGWLPFQDPLPESMESLVQTMQSRISLEEFHASLHPTEFETHPKNIKRILEKHSMDLEVALNQWHRWVQWRHDLNIDSITDEVVQHELQEGVFVWRGENKQAMPCLVITPRMMKAQTRAGNYSSYKKYLIRIVEDGLRLMHDKEGDQDKVCIVYDRRGLEYDNIDPNLHQFCRQTVDQIREWYGDRIGAVYVLRTNWMYYLLYSMVLWPILVMWSKADNVVVVEEADELLEFFDEDKLFLLTYNEPDEIADQPSAVTEHTPVDTPTNNLIVENSPPPSTL